MYKKKPLFIVFEGVEGCGKSYQSKKLFKNLKKKEMTAHQISKRGGKLYCTYNGDRVTIGGDAITFLRGKIEI